MNRKVDMHKAGGILIRDRRLLLARSRGKDVYVNPFFAPAAGQEDRWLQMDVYLVRHWQGDIKPSREIEEIRWVNSHLDPNLKVGSIFEHEVIPRVKALGLID